MNDRRFYRKFLPAELIQSYWGPKAKNINEGFFFSFFFLKKIDLKSFEYTTSFLFNKKKTIEYVLAIIEIIDFLIILCIKMFYLHMKGGEENFNPK